jgi:hypothetical protein
MRIDSSTDGPGADSDSVSLTGTSVDVINGRPLSLSSASSPNLPPPALPSAVRLYADQAPASRDCSSNVSESTGSSSTCEERSAEFGSAKRKRVAVGERMGGVCVSVRLIGEDGADTVGDCGWVVEMSTGRGNGDGTPCCRSNVGMEGYVCG